MPNQKPIILLIGGIADGRGDWEHLIEIANYLKETFGDTYKIVGFVSPYLPTGSELAEAEPYVSTFETKFKLEQEEHEPGQLKANRFFDRLFNGFKYRPGTSTTPSSISEIYQQFIQSNSERILCRIDISFLLSCQMCCGTVKPIFPVISMREYGKYIIPNYYGNVKNLDMGFSRDYSCGIRIYNVPKEKIDCLEILYKENQDLYDKILKNVKKDQKEQKIQHHTYFTQRKLLPGDLRNKDAILKFISFNLQLYGSQCDFYLPKKFFNDSSEDLKVEVSRICKEYGIECKYIDPRSSTEDALLDQNQCRIFSGFELSDHAYKGMYLANKPVIVGISGDDGWSLAISSGNLPFHGKVFDLQRGVMCDLIRLSKDLNLNNLTRYLIVFLKPEYMKKLSEINSETLSLIQQEYSILCNYIKENMNIFTKLNKEIKLIEIYNTIKPPIYYSNYTRDSDNTLSPTLSPKKKNSGYL